GGGEDFIHSLVHITAAVGAVFGRDGVEAEIAGADPDAGLAAEAAGDAHHLQLAFGVEAVAGLDLDGGDAGGLEPGEAGQGEGVEVILRGGAGGGDGRDDAAAGAGDVLIGGAAEPLFELAGAVAAEDEMGVAVDQAGGDPAAVEAVGFHRLVHRQVGAGAGPDDAAIGDQQGPVVDGAVGLAALGHGGEAAVGDEEVGPHLCSNPANSSQNQRPAVREPRSPSSREGSYSVRSTAFTFGWAPITRVPSKKSWTETPPGRAPGEAGHWLRSMTSMSKST